MHANITSKVLRVVTLAGGLLMIVGTPTGQLHAWDSRDLKGAVVEEVRNEHAPFLVRVDVDHPDRLYRQGDTMTVTVQSEKAGYLYLFYFMADGRVPCLFPNKLHKDNHVEAHEDTIVPAPGADFRIRIGPPYGKEVLKAVVSLMPLKTLDMRSLTKNQMTEIGTKGIRGAYAEKLKREPTTWAEHEVWIETMPEGTRGLRHRALRIGIFIGISEYEDRRIRPLAVPDKDARAMEETMSRLCNLDHSFLLVNEQATLENIRNTIVRRVAKLTQPGDTVICYISTHGGRCADDNGDEEDGYDEFLVVYDSDIENLRTIRSSVLMDDTFGRWLQALDGRKVIVVTDTCYSAGQATGEKGLAGIDVAEYAKYAKGLPMPGVKGSAEFDFLDGEFARVKDIGQREVALLASAMAAQTAFERREGDLSVMTHCLLELINTSRGPVTLEAAYQYVLREVPKYVEKRFPGTTQTPVLVNHTTPPVYIRP